VVRQETAEELEQKRLALQRKAMKRVIESHAEAGGGDGEAAPAPKQGTVVRTMPKVGRNDPCPCGSGKKYKKCHGVSEAA
jgi:preprotein translocase subunit SecA